eukprot:1837908-Prymnesium_polylepis.2
MRVMRVRVLLRRPAQPIKPVAAEHSLAQREASWAKAGARLEAARDVIIVGAGAVGVELAGEILTKFPQKKVTFVDMAPTILPGFAPKCAQYSLAWLQARGVVMRLGEAIAAIDDASITLKSGEVMAADVVYKCVGVMPNTAMLKESPFKSAFGFRDSIVVNDQLQLAGHPNIFAVGDMMSHDSRELKLGHTAEVRPLRHEPVSTATRAPRAHRPRVRTARGPRAHADLKEGASVCACLGVRVRCLARRRAATHTCPSPPAAACRSTATWSRITSRTPKTASPCSRTRRGSSAPRRRPKSSASPSVREHWRPPKNLPKHHNSLPPTSTPQPLSKNLCLYLGAAWVCGRAMRQPRAHGSPEMPTPVRAAGAYDASLGFNWLVVNGWVSAVFKWLLEWTKARATPLAAARFSATR